MMVDKVVSPLSLRTSDKGIQLGRGTGREMADRGLQTTYQSTSGAEPSKPRRAKATLRKPSPTVLSPRDGTPKLTSHGSDEGQSRGRGSAPRQDGSPGGSGRSNAKSSSKGSEEQASHSPRFLSQGSQGSSFAARQHRASERASQASPFSKRSGPKDGARLSLPSRGREEATGRRSPRTPRKEGGYRRPTHSSQAKRRGAPEPSVSPSPPPVWRRPPSSRRRAQASAASKRGPSSRPASSASSGELRRTYQQRHEQHIRKRKRRGPSASDSAGDTVLAPHATTFGRPNASRPEALYPEVALSKAKFRPALLQKAVRAKHSTVMQREPTPKAPPKERSRPRAKKRPAGSRNDDADLWTTKEAAKDLQTVDACERLLSPLRDDDANLWTADDDDGALKVEDGLVEVTGRKPRLSSSSGGTYDFLDSPTSQPRKPRQLASILPLPKRGPANIRKSF